MKLALVLIMSLVASQCQNKSPAGADTYTVYPHSKLKKGDFWYFSIDAGPSTVYILDGGETQFVFEHPPREPISIDVENEIPLTKFMIIHEGCQYQPRRGYLRESSREKEALTFEIKLEAEFIDGDQFPAPLKIDKVMTFYPTSDSN